MSIPVYRLYNERNNPYKLELRAGRNGLYKEVAWVHIMEDTEYASFLSKNELIFTTGMGKGDNARWLQEFIAALIAIGSTGVVLNIGKYITEEDITEDVAALCNEHQFPLFTMPWNIRLSDITQDFLYSIFLTKQKEYEIVSACKQLFFEQRPLEAINRLKLHGFTERGNYQVMALHFQDVQSVDQLETLLTSYKFILNEQGAKYIVFPLKKLIVLMMKVENPDEAAKMIQDLYVQLHDREDPRGAQDAQQHRQVIERAGLARVRRGEVHRQTADRELHAVGLDGAAHALARLLDGRIRQADDVKPRQAVGHVALHADRVAGHAPAAEGLDFGQQAARLLSRTRPRPNAGAPSHHYFTLRYRAPCRRRRRCAAPRAGAARRCRARPS